MRRTHNDSAESVPRRAALTIAGIILGVHTALCFGTATQVSLNPMSEDDIRLRLDPNAASTAELALLPRIGPKLADSIVVWRSSAAPGRAFGCPEDLDAVPRIGPATIEGLRPFLWFPDHASPTPVEDAP